MLNAMHITLCNLGYLLRFAFSKLGLLVLLGRTKEVRCRLLVS